MDRTEFLNLALRCSHLKGGALDIKQNVPPSLQVCYKGARYYPTGYQMQMKQGVVLHIALLHDLKAHSIIHADLKEVKPYAAEALPAKADSRH